MKRYIICMTAALLLSVWGSFARENGDEVTQHRLFPSNKELKTRHHGKEDTQHVIDSLNRIIESLRSELSYRDSIENSFDENRLSYDTDRSGEEIYTAEKTDSLLNMWYLETQISKQISDCQEYENIEDIAGFNSDSVLFSTNVPDSVLIQRLSKMNSFITLPFNNTVRNYMILYSEKNREKMKRIISLSDYYFPIFEEILNKYDMPLELKYMSVIESALNPVARSRVGARGIWQFMYQTARTFGLKINSFVDERLDVVKAADAGARYMMDAYKIFGDWALAISSYNCGPGNVNKAIRRSGGKRDFWSIYPYLPRETRGYVPAFVGCMYAMTYYKEYGIVPDPSPMPPHVDTFIINKNLHFKQINEIVGVPMETLRELNPQYISDIVPGNEGPHVVKLPFNFTNAFIDCQDTLYRHRADSLISPGILKNIENSGSAECIRYKVKNGDFLGKIAKRYHVSVNQIMKWNHLKSSNLRIGQVLLIYGSNAAYSQAVGQKSKETQSSQSSQTSNSSSSSVYVVKSGDSLYSIAQKYPGISAQDIMKHNGIGSSIKPGQKLKIPTK